VLNDQGNRLSKDRGGKTYLSGPGTREKIQQKCGHSILKRDWKGRESEKNGKRERLYAARKGEDHVPGLLKYGRKFLP